MYDSIDLQGITGAKPGDIIAYYLNGGFAVPSILAVENLFSPARFRLASIDVQGTRPDYARIADVETGAMRPGQLEQWLQDFAETNPAYEGGGRGEVYCSRSTIPAVRAGTGRYVLGRDYYLWVATGDGSLYTGPGVNACQNVWSRLFDSSVVFDPRWLSGVGSAS
jgi:hypothetical protein